MMWQEWEQKGGVVCVSDWRPLGRQLQRWSGRAHGSGSGYRTRCINVKPIIIVSIRQGRRELLPGAGNYWVLRLGKAFRGQMAQ